MKLLQNLGLQLTEQINKTNARYSGKLHILDENPYLIHLFKRAAFWLQQ